MAQQARLMRLGRGVGAGLLPYQYPCHAACQLFGTFVVEVTNLLLEYPGIRSAEARQPAVQFMDPIKILEASKRDRRNYLVRLDHGSLPYGFPHRSVTRLALRGRFPYPKKQAGPGLVGRSPSTRCHDMQKWTAVCLIEVGTGVKK